jgi:hypothetical protein
MLVSLKNTCLSLEKAKSLPPDDIKGKILIGEFVGGKGGEA